MSEHLAIPVDEIVLFKRVQHYGYTTIEQFSQF